MPTSTITSTIKKLTEQEYQDIMTAKANPWANRGKAMKVVFRTMSDGSVKVAMPIGAPPDSVGYNMNRALQRERRSKIAVRLQAKLMAKKA